MSVHPRLRELLERRAASYTVLTHPVAHTAQETARAIGLAERQLAKVVVIRHGALRSLAVLPAHARVDLPRLSAALRERVTPASEQELAAAFPDCELGAIPPFGALYGVTTYLDESLTHDRTITFNAGTHVDAIRMPFEEYRRIAAPVILWLAESMAGAEG